MTKRANGEGSTYRRSDGSWSGVIPYRGEKGVAERRTVYGKTQTEVRAELQDSRERLDAGAPVRDTAMSVGTWLRGVGQQGARGQRPQAGHEGPLRRGGPQAPRPDSG